LGLRTTLTCALIALTFATAARADGDAAAAGALFTAGRDDVKAGRYEQACPKFAESYRLQPATGTLFNLADCEEHVGRIASAWQHFREAADKMPADDERLPIAKQRIAELEPKLPKIVIRLAAGAPSGTTVARDGVELGEASFGLALPADPGKHEVAVSAPGHETKHYEVDLAPAAVKELEVTAGPPVAVAAKPAPEHPTTTATTSGGGAKTIGWTLVGLGGAGVAAGAITGVLAHGKKSTADDHCPDKVCDPTGSDAVDAGKSLATVSTIAWIGGAAALAVGTTLLVVGGGSGREAKAAIAPSIGPHEAALGVVGRF
jgi:hypothetical protein